ncbi:MAG TPA: Trm112 family protein [Myxococcota bacterium]|nr:Trm112 family protein [Myxococcota bacterium]
MKWVEILVCPRCRGPLKAAPGGLACAPCKRLYPVVDGIPRLAPEESRKL